MAKSNDIVGTIRIPEAGYGRFWNFMKTMPGAEFAPLLDATATPETKRSHGKVSEGSTGKCLVLNALVQSALNTRGITAIMTNAGKSPKSVGNVIFELKKDKLIRQTADNNYSITAAGTAYIKNNCKGA